jgi:hypothetical protein
MTHELSPAAVDTILSQGTTVTRTALSPTGGQLIFSDPRDRCAEFANTVRVTDLEFLEDVLSEWWRTKTATSPADGAIRSPNGATMTSIW